MGKLNVILVFFSFFITLSSIPNSEAKVSITKLHFFVQDRMSGPNQTEYLVAQSNISSTSSTSFGQVDVVDNPITIGPKPGSKFLGRVQGTVVLADMNEIGFHMSLVFYFTTGKYNGSTLTMIGRNNLSHKYRKMPIVGGTGAFDFARGIATTNTISVDYATRIGTFQYNIVIIREY